MQGLIYLLNQAGEALAAANGEIARLHQEIEQLCAQSGEATTPTKTREE